MADEENIDVDLRSTEDDDHLKELQKISAVSVVSSGMDRTQSPSQWTPPKRSPLTIDHQKSRGKVAEKLRFSTPTKETSAPCLSSMFGHISAIGSQSIVSLPSPGMTPQMVDSVLNAALKPKATTSEIIRALERMRIQNADKTPMRRSPLRQKSCNAPSETVSSFIRPNFPHGDNLLRTSSFLIFTSKEQNTREKRVVRMTNAGKHWIQVRISVENGKFFKIMNGTIRSLFPGEEQSIWVEFRPNSLEKFTDCLLVDNLTDEHQMKVHLLGLGGLPQISMLKAPNLVEHEAIPFTYYTLRPKTRSHLYFGVKSTGNRTAFCKVVVLSDNEVLSCVIRPTANVVLEQGEIKQFEIDLPYSEGESSISDTNLTILLLWGLEFHRQRMTAFLHKSGYLPMDPAISLFKEEFWGELPFDEDENFEVEMNDLETFNTSLQKIPIHVNFENAATEPLNLENLFISSKITED